MTSTTLAVEPASIVRASTGGLGLAIVSAGAFGLSGTMGRSLFDLGWTPAAVVAARVGGAFVILVIPCLLLIRRIGWPSRRQTWRLVAYGIVAVGMAQLCYFNAVQYLQVGVALLLEYLAPVLLIGWHWAISRRRPPAAVFVGAGLAIAGLIAVLDLGSNLSLHPIGVAWGLAAAVCLAGYFVLSDTGGGGDAVHPLLLTTAGTGVGALTVLLTAALGFQPLAARAGSTTLAGERVGWWLPMLVLVLITAVVAYFTGILAVRRLGSSVASFVALIEVLFAVTFAFLLLGQQPSAMQLLGGGLVLAGIAVVQRPRRTVGASMVSTAATQPRRARAD